MIDPKHITKFNRSASELEEFALFSVIVAGKRAEVQAKKLDEFLSPYATSPFESIRIMLIEDSLGERLRRCRMGQYKRIAAAFSGLTQLDEKIPLAQMRVGDLQSISGIGPKTARFFLLHSRPNQQLAVLDTHILHWLRDQYYDEAPLTTPQNPKSYRLWENIFLRECYRRQKHPAEMDLEIWREYSATIAQRKAEAALKLNPDSQRRTAA